MVAAAYRAAQVFAFPSRTDTQGLVLQEAALAGLPASVARRLVPLLERFHFVLGVAERFWTVAKDSAAPALLPAPPPEGSAVRPLPD